MILEALYFFLPAYISNLVPPLFGKLRYFNQPIDFGRKWKGKRLFGDHKTIKGFLVACIFGTFAFHFQKILYSQEFFKSVSLINYSQTSLLLGFLLAFGAIFGDLIKSFFKRRMGKKPGKPWIPFDQIDYIIGGLLFSSFIYSPELEIVIAIVILSVLLQLLFHYTGYLLGINKDKI